MYQKLSVRAALSALALLALASATFAAPTIQATPDVAAMLTMDEGESNETAESLIGTGGLTGGVLTDGAWLPEVGQPVKAGSVNKDLRTLPRPDVAELARSRGLRPEVLMPPDKLAAGNLNAPDSVAQTSAALAMPSSSSSIAGLDLSNWGAGWPPDTHGDVGPNHYIQAVNTSLAIFDKASGARLAAFTFDTFFDGTGTPCDTANQGDPYVLYDVYSGRWIISDFSWPGAVRSGPYYQCIAVSKTADPVSGGWWMYGMLLSSTELNDYPKMGVWHDGIYLTANMFRKASTFSGSKVWALNRDDLISGAPLRSVAFSLGSSYASLLPAHVRASLPPTTAPEYLLARGGTTSTLRIWRMKVNWTTPTASTLTGPANINVAAFTVPSAKVPQLGSTTTLDTLSDRLMSNVAYSNIGGNEALWVNHTVSSGGTMGVRWYEIRNLNGTASVFQQGTFQPDSTYRWMGSLAIDKQGNMAVGYSASSSTLNPQIRYAGRLVGDAAGTLGQGETTLIAGTGSQTSYSRWGDYASMQVDPADGCTFWFTTEYYAATGTNWQTRIGSFKYPGCQ